MSTTEAGETPDHLSHLNWTFVHTIKSVIFSTIIITAILANSLALWAFLKHRRHLRSPTHYFLANLALSDLLVGIITLPFLAVLSVTKRWYFGPLACKLWTMGHFTLCSASILSTLAVCIERFIGVTTPLKHRSIMNKPTIIGMMVGTWVLALFLSATPLYFWPAEEGDEEISKGNLQCKTNLRIGHVIIASVGIYHLPAILMVIFYYKIYRAATAPLVQGMDATKGGGDDDDGKKNQVRLARKLSFLVGFLILSYLPMFTVFFILGLDPNFCSPQVFVALAWLRYCNSCVNPAIYAFAVPGYQKAFKAMFPWLNGHAFIRRQGGDNDSSVTSTVIS